MQGSKPPGKKIIQKLEQDPKVITVDRDFSSCSNTDGLKHVKSVICGQILSPFICQGSLNKEQNIPGLERRRLQGEHSGYAT